MKNILSIIFIITLLFSAVNAQTMDNLVKDNHTEREEAEGKAIWDKLQIKKTQCADLRDADFEALGEYFMGQMMGDSHAAMNAMMVQMHGEEGEEQIHIVMGKRLSGCDTSAVFPSEWSGWMPMMMNMGGGWSPMMWNMGYGFGWFGELFMLLWWALIIIGIIALVRWLLIQSRVSSDHDKSPLEILKERYARGEVDKKEFEEKKKDLS